MQDNYEYKDKAYECFKTQTRHQYMSFKDHFSFHTQSSEIRPKSTHKKESLLLTF